MTRMWCVDPVLLCRQHLLGEHNELHKLVGSINRGHSVAGYVEQGYIDTSLIASRHEELAEELIRRGYSHESPLEYTDQLELGSVDVCASLAALSDRCDRCAARIERRCGSSSETDRS